MNRKMINILKIAAILGLATLVLVLATSMAMAASNKNSTNGSGTFDGGSVVINAKQDKKGISGSAQIEFYDYSAQGPVVCYAALSSNVTQIEFQIDQAEGNVGSAQSVILWVEDNSSNGMPPDLIMAQLGDNPVPPCGIGAAVGEVPLLSGNINIKNEGKF